MNKGTSSWKQVAALSAVALCWAAPSPAAQRSFLMGTSSFADFFQFKFENLSDKDMVSLHIDDFIGIPWTEFQNNTPPPTPWVTRVQTIRDGAKATGKVIFMSLGPLGARKTLASKVDASGNPIQNWAPTDASGCYAFDSDPNAQAYKQAYINYAKYMVDTVHPDFLALVVEMNVEFDLCPSHKAGFIQWYSDVYRAMKLAYPGLPMFATMQFEHLYGMSDPTAWCGGPKSDTSLAACFQQKLNEAVAIPGDRMAFSMYPANFYYPPTAPDTYTPVVPYEDAFSRVQKATNRKIWISETGVGAVDILGSYQHAAPPSSCGIDLVPTPIVNGERNMANHMSHLLQQAQSKNFEGVVWWENRDYLDAVPAAACPCPDSSFTCTSSEQLYTSAGGGQAGNTLEFSWRSFGNMGLRNNDGTPRTAVYSIWTSYLNQSFSPVPGGNGNSLEQIQIYPNPLRPASGHTGMNFLQLPPGTRLRVYTLAGEKVQELTADAVGHATWDGTNQAGQKAASGVYLVYVQEAGDSKTLKVAIQR